MGKTVKKKKARKKLSPLAKIRKELDKLEKLHEKEEAIVESINDIIDEENFKDEEDFEWK
jgi:GTPase involved in cell partitioning and DNA repair